MKTALWFLLGLAGLGGVAWWAYMPADAIHCPKGTDFDALLGRIRSGDTELPVAENMAASYETAGCKDAAEAIRTAIAARKSATGPGGVSAPGDKAGHAMGWTKAAAFAAAPAPNALGLAGDPFAVNRLREPLRTQVQQLLAKRSNDWTSEDLLVTGPAVGIAILADFGDRKVGSPSRYVAGVTPTDAVTAYTQWRAKIAMVQVVLGPVTLDLSGDTATRSATAPGYGATPTGGGDGGNDGDLSLSGDLEGSVG